MPTKYIHEPWIAPGPVQKAAKCLIGEDYPLPMVNHAVASRINIERMKQVYLQLSKYKNLGKLLTDTFLTRIVLYVFPSGRKYRRKTSVGISNSLAGLSAS